MNVFIAPSRHSVWYATVDVGGPYRSDDAGRSWRPLHLEDRLGGCGRGAAMARGFSVDPRDEDSFVTATGDGESHPGSLIVSRDGGMTYRRTGSGRFLSNGLRRMHGLALDRNPYQPDELVAGEYLDGLHLSFDNGESWTTAGPTNFWFSDVRYDRIRTGTIYACAPRYKGHGGFARSIDGGRRWTILSTNSPTEVCQINGQAEIIGLFQNRVMISRDGGESWSDYSDGLILENLVTDGDPNPAKSTGSYIAAGAGSDFYLVGNRRGDIFKRHSGGSRWVKTPRESQRPGDPPSEYSISWSCQCKKMDSLCATIVVPDEDNHWLACDWHVIWESMDSGRNWVTRVKGLTPLCPFVVSGSPAREDVILYGVADMGMYVSTNNACSFEPIRVTSGVNCISFSVYNPLIGYAVGGKCTLDLIKTTDGGATWVKIKDMRGIPELKPKKLAAYSVAVDPLTDNVYVAVSGPNRPSAGGVYRSSDGGISWQWCGKGLPEGEDLFKESEFSKGHADSQLVFSSDGSFLACSQKTGHVARFVRDRNSWVAASVHVWGSRIFADPHVPGRFIHAARQSSESLDGGRSFHPYPSIPKDSWSLAFDMSNRGWLVAGADKLYLSKDGGKTFEPIVNGLSLPANGSRALSLNRGRLFFLTYGSGVWMRNLIR